MSEFTMHDLHIGLFPFFAINNADLQQEFNPYNCEATINTDIDIDVLNSQSFYETSDFEIHD